MIQFKIRITYVTRIPHSYYLFQNQNKYGK